MADMTTANRFKEGELVCFYQTEAQSEPLCYLDAETAGFKTYMETNPSNWVLQGRNLWHQLGTFYPVFGCILGYAPLQPTFQLGKFLVPNEVAKLFFALVPNSCGKECFVIRVFDNDAHVYKAVDEEQELWENPQGKQIRILTTVSGVVTVLPVQASHESA